MDDAGEAVGSPTEPGQRCDNPIENLKRWLALLYLDYFYSSLSPWPPARKEARRRETGKDTDKRYSASSRNVLACRIITNVQVAAGDGRGKCGKGSAASMYVFGWRSRFCDSARDTFGFLTT